MRRRSSRRRRYYVFAPSSVTTSRRLTCTSGCVGAAGYIQAQIKQNGAAPGTSASGGCADAAQLLPLVQRLLTWMDVNCGVEPSNIVYTQYLSYGASNATVCPLPSAGVQLTAPVGVLSSLVETVGASGLTAAQAQAASDAAVERGVRTMLGALAAGGGTQTLVRYGQSMACQWTIVPADTAARYIRLRVLFLSTEPSYDELWVQVRRMCAPSAAPSMRRQT